VPRSSSPATSGCGARGVIVACRARIDEQGKLGTQESRELGAAEGLRAVRKHRRIRDTNNERELMHGLAVASKRRRSLADSDRANARGEHRDPSVIDGRDQVERLLERRVDPVGDGGRAA